MGNNCYIWFELNGSNDTIDKIYQELNTIGFKPYVSTDSSSTPGLAFVDGTTNATSPKQFAASNWRVLTYTASDDAPTSLAEDGQRWYNSIVDEVDIMYHNGTTWVGYNDATAIQMQMIKDLLFQLVCQLYNQMVAH